MLVHEYKNVFRNPEQQVTLRGQSKSTLNNYIRRFAIHILPKLFVEIHRFGIYNRITKRELRLPLKKTLPIGFH